MNVKKAISFCQTCRNRLWQIKETLPSNLRALPEDCELVLVDYGSTDGLATWLWENYRPFVQNGSLKFFEVRNPVHWSAPIAKNLAHRLSDGDYLFNLDADNFVIADDIQMIRYSEPIGAPCHQFSGSFRDGSFGRIGLSRALFFKMGGYDESMLPMAGQDYDLLRRLVALGQTPRRLSPPKKPAILNNFSQKMGSVNGIAPDEAVAKKAWVAMERINQSISKARLATEGPIRLNGFQSFKGLLNGEMVTIDGFNRIQSATQDS